MAAKYNELLAGIGAGSLDQVKAAVESGASLMGGPHAYVCSK